MPEGLIDKLKRSFIEGSQTAVAKIEETARIAKVKLDLVADENRLHRKYSDLGEKAYLAIQAGGLQTLQEDATVAGTIKEIAEYLGKIEENKAKLAALQECCCEK